MLKSRKTIAYLLVIVSTLVATFSFYFWQVAYSPNLNVEGKEPYHLYLKPSSNYQTVLDSLKQNKLIHDQVAFAFMSKRLKLNEKEFSGHYTIEPNTSNKALMDKLRKNEQDPIKLTFNNIRTKTELSIKISKKLYLDSTAIAQILNDTATCAKYGFTPETVMAMFLPNTYFVKWDMTMDKFLGRMHDEYKKYWTPTRIQRADSLGLSPVQVAILASIVQSETNKKDEMPLVASVYLNRLKSAMPLQADPTVKFAVGDFSIKRILEKHLNISSPYNTYRNTGLPPGPIALPESVALTAVLAAPTNHYLYFCAKEDFSGYHNFSNNYAEHLVNAKKYQTALNNQGIK